ncbi:FadR family transcriptional regulator [Desulfonema ishimotonii]|uniref:FadR family transcriptional regulator n=1 Tax=Desulfonema ishimotonii TaxID=45657 RepID=A0A401G2A0_9BACT|nr:FadR/GntR family transcriptional regulator [Desulfonema ishimotonii]GBC63325.1 FadR family transcriptional regulator [Desulfonema ishimotonii]
MAAPDTHHKNRRLYESVAQQIEALIRSSGFRPGDRLPPERTLAGTFSVSRNCVREAIRTLSEKKILESRRGDGTYICAPDGSALADTLTRADRLRDARLRDIFEFRQLIEPQIAALAARNITPEQLDRLKILFFEQERKLLAGEDVSAPDMEFHRCLAAASGNRVIQEVIRALGPILSESRAGSLQTDQRKNESFRSHIRIIDALERGDADGACQAMRDHLRRVEQALFGDTPECPDQNNEQIKEIPEESDSKR